MTKTLFVLLLSVITSQVFSQRWPETFITPECARKSRVKTIRVVRDKDNSVMVAHSFDRQGKITGYYGYIKNTYCDSAFVRELHNGHDSIVLFDDAHKDIYTWRQRDSLFTLLHNGKEVFDVMEYMDYEKNVLVEWRTPCGSAVHGFAIFGSNCFMNYDNEWSYVDSTFYETTRTTRKHYNSSFDFSKTWLSEFYETDFYPNGKLKSTRSYYRSREGENVLYANEEFDRRGCIRVSRGGYSSVVWHFENKGGLPSRLRITSDDDLKEKEMLLHFEYEFWEKS